MLMAFGALAAVVICLDAAGVSENSLLPGIGFSNSGPAGGFVSLSLVATVCLWLDTGKRTVLKTILPFLPLFFRNSYSRIVPASSGIGERTYFDLARVRRNDSRQAVVRVWS